MNLRHNCKTLSILTVATIVAVSDLRAQVPSLINYQGRVAVNGTNFEGTGQFKFAFVNSDGSETLWSNDGTSKNGSEPADAVPLTVTKGLYSVSLGDDSLTNMSPLPSWLFSESDVRLRVWFDDGAHGSELLTPDQRITSAGYAMIAATVADSSITADKIAPNAVLRINLAPEAVGPSQIAPGAVDFTRLAVSGNAQPGQVLGFDGNGFIWTTPGGGGGGGSPWLLNGTSAYYNSGNVGIGTSSPQSKLHLAGSADALRLTGSHPFLTLDDTAFGLYSRIEGDGAGLNLKTQGAVTGSNPGGQIHLDGTGTVGIGTSTPPHQLSIKSFPGGPSWTSNAWGGAISLDNGAAIGWQTNTAGQRFGMGHSNGGFRMFRTSSNPGVTTNPATYDFAVKDDGKVGIGTDSPETKLEVQTGTGSNGIMHSDGQIKVGSYVGGSGSGASGGWLGTFSNDALHLFANNGQPSLTVATNGNVGVGTTAPVDRLHVETNQANAAAVFGKATGNGGFGVYGKSALGPAVYAEGNATQSPNSGGFVKAMVYVDPFRPASQYVVRCFNSQQTGSATSTAPCGITVTRSQVGIYDINFGFSVEGRFASVSTDTPIRILSVSPGGNSVSVTAFDPVFNKDLRDTTFTVILY